MYSFTTTTDLPFLGDSRTVVVTVTSGSVVCSVQNSAGAYIPADTFSTSAVVRMDLTAPTRWVCTGTVLVDIL